MLTLTTIRKLVPPKIKGKEYLDIKISGNTHINAKYIEPTTVNLVNK